MSTEQAFNSIIKNNYKDSFTRFHKLYSADKNNSLNLNGCIISLILMEDIDSLISFIDNESSTANKSYLLFLRENFIIYNRSTGSVMNKKSVFDLILSSIDLLTRNGYHHDTELFIRTAQLLKPDDSSIYRYLSELEFKKGFIEKGCSLLVKASTARLIL